MAERHCVVDVDQKGRLGGGVAEFDLSLFGYTVRHWSDRKLVHLLSSGGAHFSFYMEIGVAQNSIAKVWSTNVSGSHICLHPIASRLPRGYAIACTSHAYIKLLVFTASHLRKTIPHHEVRFVLHHQRSRT